MGRLRDPIEAVTVPVVEAAARAAGLEGHVMRHGFTGWLYDRALGRVVAEITFHSHECPCGWRYLPGRFRECANCGAQIGEARRP